MTGGGAAGGSVEGPAGGAVEGPAGGPVGGGVDGPAGGDAVQVRIPRVNLLAVVVAAVCTVPLAFASPWLAVLWLLPVLGGVHVLRAGVDADRTGLTTRTALTTRRLAWDDIAGLRISRNRLAAVRRSGSAVRLPVVRLRHLPAIAAVSGGRLPDPGAEPAPQQPPAQQPPAQQPPAQQPPAQQPPAQQPPAQ